MNATLKRTNQNKHYTGASKRWVLNPNIPNTVAFILSQSNNKEGLTVLLIYKNYRAYERRTNGGRGLLKTAEYEIEKLA